MILLSIFTIFMLLAGHALADYPLQGSFLSSAKRKGGIDGFPWPIALLSHGLIHGFMVAMVVYFVTTLAGLPLTVVLFYAVFLGLSETLLHSWIDYLKCNNKIGIYTDQLLHVWCKTCWATIILVTIAELC